MIKHPLLYNEQWLKEKYLDNKLVARQIARLIGCQHTAVYDALKRYSIQTRSRREAIINKYESDNFVLNLPVIEGGLLGDAMLRCQGKQNGTYASSMPYFRRKNKYKDHVDWVAELLCGDWGKSHVKDVSARMFTGAWCQCYEFCTRSHDELMPLYDRWYPASNNFKKVVPKDFVLDRVSLLHWFLDDGSTSYRTRNGIKTNQIVCSLSSDCFTLEDQHFLANQMKDIWSLNAKVRFYKHSKTSIINNGDLYRIHIPTSQIQYFYEIIGECPIDSLKYKWK